LNPITKAEVEAAYWSRPILKPHEIKDAQKFINSSRIPSLTLVGWLLVGYEIARARAEKGEKRWELLKSKFPGVAETIEDLIEKEENEHGE
jgi:hypothetical protein